MSQAMSSQQPDWLRELMKNKTVRRYLGADDPQDGNYGEFMRTMYGTLVTLLAVLCVLGTLVALFTGQFVGLLFGAVLALLSIRYAYRVWTKRAHWFIFWI
jgi:hypothetical protein